jgi:YcxB-like protein
MEQEHPIEVDYELQESDMAAFAKYVNDSRERTIIGKATQLRKVWFILLPIILVAGVILSDSHFAGVLFVFFALVGLQQLWRKWYLKMYYQVLADNVSKGSLGKRKIILQKDLFVEIRPFLEGRLAWKGIYDVVFTKDHIFIRTCETRGFIVPMRAFKDAAKSKLFGDTLEHLWKAGCEINSEASSNVSAG